MHTLTLVFALASAADGGHPLWRDVLHGVPANG